MGILDYLICLLRNLYPGKKQLLEPDLKMDWFQIEKGVLQGCIFSRCLFNIFAEYIIRIARLDEAQAGIKIARRKSITSDRQMTPPL